MVTSGAVFSAVATISSSAPGDSTCCLMSLLSSFSRSAMPVSPCVGISLSVLGSMLASTASLLTFEATSSTKSSTASLRVGDLGVEVDVDVRALDVAAHPVDDRALAALGDAASIMPSTSALWPSCFGRSV